MSGAEFRRRAKCRNPACRRLSAHAIGRPAKPSFKDVNLVWREGRGKYLHDRRQFRRPLIAGLLQVGGHLMGMADR